MVDSQNDSQNAGGEIPAGNGSDSGDYDASKIQVMEGLEAVRKRPGMYIGDTHSTGLHHLVYEIVDNSIDEAMAGYCNEIQIKIHENGSVSVVDNGRGIPVGIHPKYNKPALEIVMTVLHAGGKFDSNAYKVSGGLHGVGMHVVNALSERLDVRVKRDGNTYFQHYEYGKPKTELTVVEEGVNGTGTAIHFMPDKSIFETTVYDYDILAARLRDLAYLNKGVKIVLSDERQIALDADGKPKQDVFQSSGGISEFVTYMNRNKAALHPVISFYGKSEPEGAKAPVEVEVAMQCTNEYSENILTFVNNINTREGGTHLIGLKAALTRTINDYARKNNMLKGEDVFQGDDVREGLTAILAVKMHDPQFEGQTKMKLGNSEMKGIVESLVNDRLSRYFEEHPAEAKNIIQKAVQAFYAREAARKARELARRKTVFGSGGLPGKLSDCSNSDPSKCEIYIVEGDSAGGCFSGDTEIALLDGRNIPFKQLAEEHEKGEEHFCYTMMHDGHIGIQRIEHPRITKRNAKVIKIVLDNDEEIVCTPDHLFMLRDGSFRQAKDLHPADSLMPLRRQISRKGKRITIEGYELLFDPADSRWIFTHVLSDEYNLRNAIYKDIGKHRHHNDLNKLNNNPANICRLTKEEHIALHSALFENMILRSDVQEKLQKIRQSPEYKRKISQKMLSMKGELSKRARSQWENEEYKKYMVAKFLEFYNNNPECRAKSKQLLAEAQKNYWASSENRLKQAERVKKHFIDHPERKQELSALAKSQWNNSELRAWRSEKTKTQWTPKFRVKRKKAYDRTYFDNTIRLLRKIYDENDKVDIKKFENARKALNNKNMLSFETFCERFFDSDVARLEEAVANYNHKIKKISFVDEPIDVYDLEVPGTHNFALASGVFVHNSAKQGRNREFQAILPLRGKILNVEKARIDKAFENAEIQALATAIGTGVGEEFDLAKARYHKIIIMCDADVDGAHICTLLLTFFFRYMRQLIDAGYVYIAQPPLYRIAKGKAVRYAYSDEEKNRIYKEMGGEVSRYKGLGEMNPEQLWDTTMDPANRTTLKVNVEDAALADRLFTILMGEEVEPRKEFIYAHAKEVTNLDI